MKHNLFMAAHWLLLPAGLVWLSGCGSGQTHLVDAGKIRLETRASGRVYVAWADTYEEEGGLLVTGVLARKDAVGLPIKTSVEVEVVSANGSILDTAQSDAINVPRREVNRIPGFTRFRIRLSQIPPAGARICVTPRCS